MLATNPVLESFGNSKTARNNNSSRFGKWIQLNYRAAPRSSALQLAGARITQYLLEKSRVVVHSGEERNYHIFYQLCGNAVLDLQPAANYRYLRRGTSLTVPDMDDRAAFQETLQSMDALGFSTVDKDTIFAALKAILLLGNVVFVEDRSNGDAADKPAAIGRDFQPLIHSISQILSWDVNELTVGLTGRTLTLRGETSRISFNTLQAQQAVNALAKEIYGRIFSFIVYQANQSLQADEFRSIALSDDVDKALSIGVLDIFGFEKFKSNSFEQLCINYANEKLHQYFVTYVLKKEQMLYESEGIASSFVVPIDNSDVLLLLEAKKNGIFARLDDEIKLPKGSDEGFLKKIEADHNQRGVPTRRFIREVKMAVNHFEIRHFAGQILYDCAGFLEKNRDKLFDHLESLLASSANERFRDIMTTDWANSENAIVESSSGKSVSVSTTIATRFQAQLQSLMEMLNRSQPHFIKCIKPNNVKEAGVFEEQLVTLQLRYSGVLEAIQIRKSGYPTRRSHEKFWKSFWMVPPLTDRHLLLTMSDHHKCALIIARLCEYSSDLSDIQLGKTLVFLRPNTTKLLEDEKEVRKIKATMFGQTQYRRMTALKVFKKLVQVRDKLRLAQANGSRFKSSNVAAINEITAAVVAAKTHALPKRWIATAEKLLQRLHQIKDCLEKLSHFEHASTTRPDVVEEYHELKGLLETAADLQIESSQITKVNARLLALKERAECTLLLRDAIDAGDEFAIRESLQVVEKLSSVQGKFCEKEVRIAEEKLVLIDEDHNHSQKTVDLIASFQTKFNSLLISNPVDRVRMSAYFKEFDQVLNDHLQLWHLRAPVSARVETFLKLIKNIQNLHRCWSAHDWAQTTDLVQHISAMSVQIAQDMDTMGAKAHKYISELGSCVHMEIKSVQHDIQVNVLLPKFVKAVEHGSVQGSPGTIDFGAIDVDALAAVVEEVRGYTWLDGTMEPLLLCVDAFLDLKVRFLDKSWDRIVALVETSAQRHQRKIALQKWFDRIKQSTRVGENMLTEVETQLKNLEPIECTTLSALSQHLGAVYGGICLSMANQANLMLAEAVDRMVQRRLTEIVQFQITSDEDIDQIALSECAQSVAATLEFIREVLPIYANQCEPSKATADLIGFVESLMVLWNIFDGPAWQTVVELWDTNKIVLLGATTMEDEVLNNCLQVMKSNAAHVILQALTKSTVSTTSEELASSAFSFCNSDSLPTGDAAIAVSRLKHSTDIARTRIAKIKAQLTDADQVQNIEAFLDFVATAVKSREVFIGDLGGADGVANREIALSNLRSNFENLATSPYFDRIAAVVDKEMQEMEYALKFADCVGRICDALKPNGVSLSYLLPATDGAEATSRTGRPKRATAVGAAALHLTASPSIGKHKTIAGESSPVVGGTAVIPESAEELILKDHLMYNKALLVDNTNALNECLEQAHELLEELQGDDQGMPGMLQDYVTAVELIRDIRNSIVAESWGTAFEKLTETQSLGLEEKVKQIREEIQINADTIRNYAVIISCYNSLSTGQPKTRADYKSLSTTSLDDSIKLGQTIGCISERAQGLFEAVLFISDLRKAQKLGDWAEISSVLNQRDGKELPSICSEEVVSACRERDNYEMVQALKGAISTEELPVKEGALDIEEISISMLSAANEKVNKYAESNRGALLSCLHELAKVVLQTRKSAKDRQWLAVEQMLPVLRNSIEKFQNDLDDKRAVSGSRTSSSLRTSVMSNTTPNSKHKSILADSSGITSTRSALWEEFAELTQCVKRESKSIEHHFAVIALEKRLNEKLGGSGMKINVDGTIDIKSVVTTELQDVLEQATNLDLSNMSLPLHLKMLRKVGMLILDIRQALLKDEWTKINTLLEETLGGDLTFWPEACRLEIQTVRKESENKYIINALTNGLLQGKLDGEVGKTNLSSVSNFHLTNCIELAKSLGARTEIAKSLVWTAEAMYGLRELLIVAPHSGREVDWLLVRKRTKEVLLDIQANKLHPVIHPEVKLMEATADDQITCNMLMKALKVGGPTGEPGALHIANVVTKDLDKAYNTAVRSTIKTIFAESLQATCRKVLKMREAIMRTASPLETNRSMVTEAWNTINTFLQEISEEQAAIQRLPAVSGFYNSQSAKTLNSWDVCAEEIELIRKHAAVEALKHRIIDTTTRASHVYAERNEHTLSTELTPINILTDEFVELVVEMENILQLADTNSFNSEFLDRYRSCAMAIHQLRKTLSTGNFDELMVELNDPDIRTSVSILSETKQEFCWIMCEYHNSTAISILRLALESSVEDDQLASDQQREMKAWRGESFVQRNQRLHAALESVRHLKVTSKLAKQWLECCENMYLLRWNLEKRNHSGANQALRWFKNTAKICPMYIKMEAQRAYVIYQNDVLLQDLTVLLTSGKPIGKVGEVNVENIEVTELSALINQAATVQPLFAEPAELLDAARVALSIRTALKSKDTIALQEIVDDLSAQDSHNLLIIDEIATARAELDNAIATSALITALRSFEDSEARAFDISFLQDGNANAASAVGTDAAASPLPGVRKTAAYSILESLSERRYSFANKNSANIDPDTIDVNALDGGLRIARDHGVRSVYAMRLYRTVELVKSLRMAMKQADWGKLEDVLVSANYEQEVGVRYDIIASKEILAVRSQLEIRAAIVDLSKALRRGWAKCSQGIVDTSSMENERLANAIDCADRCIMELSIQIADVGSTCGNDGNRFQGELASQDQRKAFLENSPVHRRVKLLMESAKQVLRIREVLAMGNMELAGNLAEEALGQPLHHSVVEELRLYSKEINIALSAMNISETLRGHVSSGKTQPLFQAIAHAYELESHLSADLGLIRVLDNAERTYRGLVAMRQLLQQTLVNQFDSQHIQRTLLNAEAMHFCDPELAQAAGRKDKLDRLQVLLGDLDVLWPSLRCERAALKKVVDRSVELELAKHPKCQLLKLLLRTNGAALRTIKMRQASCRPLPNAYAIATETIRWKRAFLELPASATKYRLESFPKLRRAEDFALRMTIVSEELVRTMLTHSDQPLPTSLTALPPAFAAIAVLIFTDCVRGVEHNIFTCPAMAVRQLLDVGRACVHLRDEILLQLVKQIRGNTDGEASLRMWKLLCACLFHFPPSRTFESYLELFLMQASADPSDAIVVSQAQRAQRFLHRSIFLFGQQRRLRPLVNRHLDRIDRWLSEDNHVPGEAQLTPHNDDDQGPDAHRWSAAQLEASFGLIDLSDAAFPAPTPAPTVATAKGSAASASTASAAPVKPPSTSSAVQRLRGSRDDWHHRFRCFFHAKDKEPAAMSKKIFCEQLAAAVTVTGKPSELDRSDASALCFLVFGKRIADLRGVLREYSSDKRLFQFTSDDEAASSAQRRQWLWQQVTRTAPLATAADSELFLSQLQLSEAVAFAERFWELVIDTMSRDCRQFPFLRLLDRKDSITSSEGPEAAAPLSRMSSNRRLVVESKDKDKAAAAEVSINWEIFRELVLTGMRLCLLRPSS